MDFVLSSEVGPSSVVSLHSKKRNVTNHTLWECPGRMLQTRALVCLKRLTIHHSQASYLFWCACLFFRSRLCSPWFPGREMRGDLLGRFRESLCVLCTQGGEWQHVRSVRRSVSAGIRRCDTEVTVMMMMMMHAASSFSCSLRGALVITGLLTSLYVCTF